MEKRSVPAQSAGTGKVTPHKLYRDLAHNLNVPTVEGLSHFAFRRLSEKQNKKKLLCGLGVSAVRLCLGPFWGHHQATHSRAVIDLLFVGFGFLFRSQFSF